MGEMSMKTRRTATPVPGFPTTAARRADPGAGAAPAGAVGDERLDAGAPRRMLSVRVPVDLHERYAALLYELQREPRAPTMTDVVSGLLLTGPQTTGEVRAVVREWRQARDAES